MDLFSQLKHVGQSRLKKVNTVITDEYGNRFVEERNDDGCFIVKPADGVVPGYVVDLNPDLNVGFVVDGLIIGSQDVSQSYEVLKEYKVTHILNVAVGVENSFPETFVYKNVEMFDLPEFNLKRILQSCFDFIDSCRENAGICLVHCNAGVSRSSAVAIAYLMAKEGLTFDKALCHIKETRPAVNPNIGFVKQLKSFEPFFLKKEEQFLRN